MRRGTSLPYFNHSTLVLHGASLLYIALMMVLPGNAITLVFAGAYTLEAVLKAHLEGTVYLSEYYGMGFWLMDVLSGPVATICSLYWFWQGHDGAHLSSAFVLLKVLTCRSHMVTLKELCYVVRAASYYLRLSCWVFVCFSCLSFYTFRPVSKYFASLPASVFSLYQLSTFDTIDQVLNDVKQYLSDGWLLYFLVYFLLVYTTYNATMLSFFSTYYSKKEVQVSFQFETTSFVYMQGMA